MGCFWVVLVILVLLSLVVGIREAQRRIRAKKIAKQNPPPPGATQSSPTTGLMSPFVRDLIGCYLVLLAIFLSYTIYRLLAVEFPTDATAAATQTAAPSSGTVNPIQTPAPTSAAPTGQQTSPPANSSTQIVPTVTKLVPSIVNADSMPGSITVTGNNFSSQSQVRIKGELRVTELTGTGELRASLDNTLQPGTVYVEVVNGDAFSNSLPLQIVEYGKLRWCSWIFDISPDARLLLLVIMAGALGSFIHGLQSLVDFAGNSELKSSWTWWYIARPFLGIAIALVFYAALRGGMLAGTPTAVKDINPYGIFTIAALAGMFTDKATQKLAEIFDVLVKVDDKRKDPLKAGGPALKMDKFPGNKLPGGTANTVYPTAAAPTVKLEAEGGTPPYTWTVTGLPNDLKFDATTTTISGTPKEQGTKPVVITITDKNNQSATQTLSITIN